MDFEEDSSLCASIYSGISLPSLISMTSSRARLSSVDFVDSCPVRRVGKNDCFGSDGLDDDNLSVFSRTGDFM